MTQKNIKKSFAFCENNDKINVRTSMANYKEEENLINIPLYMIGNIENILRDDKGDNYS